MKTSKLSWLGILPAAVLSFSLLNCGKKSGEVPTGSGGALRTDSRDKPQYYLEANTHEIKISAYNVENLFDAVHNEGVEDYTFTPFGTPGKAEYCRTLTVPSYKKECEETDWTQEKVNIKLGKIAQAVSKQGPLPDILAVEEIENINVAQQLARALGYSEANLKITTGRDGRGINNAIFFKTDKLRPLDEVEDIVLEGPEFETGPTRNILRMRFGIVNGPQDAVIEIFVNHWPSQASGPQKRVAAARALRDAVDKNSHKNGVIYYPIAVGDFNTLETETPNAFDDVIENEHDWAYAMWDAEKASYAAGNPFRRVMPEHSYYYDRDHSWSKLDRVLLGQNWGRGDQAEGLAAVLDSFRYIADPSLLEARRDRTQGPKGFDATFKKLRNAREQGYSDHLQVAMKLRVR